LKDKDKDVRERVTEALGKIGEPAVVKSLIQNLNYDDPIVRKRAAMVLGEIGDPGAIESLVQALDKVPGIRKRAATALQKIKRRGQSHF